MDIKTLLLKQYNLYPKMQIKDMVKLIYQNEFAGGHMIKNENESLKRLQEECQYFEIASSNVNIPHYTFEEIGNGIYRLHLKALQGCNIELTTVNRFFFNTANSICGSIQSFEEKLNVLRQCCNNRELPYELEELENYLNVYKQQGYPPVSHSETYRVAYSPAYRIVKSEYCDFFMIFCKIDQLMKSKYIVNVAIDGNSGAGKSTLASLISNVYDCNVFHMDDFFLTPELRSEERLKEVGGNVDYIRFKHEVIHGLSSGNKFQYRIYDCRRIDFTESISITPKKLNIIEGAYSMHPTLISNYDMKVFLQINEKKQSDRILKRNGAYMLEKFLNEWIPLENQYFKEMKIKEQSDLIFEV